MVISQSGQYLHSAPWTQCYIAVVAAFQEFPCVTPGTVAFVTQINKIATGGDMLAMQGLSIYDQERLGLRPEQWCQV
jgi:hypothetical protein